MNIVDNAKIRAFDALIADNKKISLVAHIRPDGDALGSTIALLNYLLGRGKDAYVIYSDLIPHTLQFMVKDTCSGRIVEFPAYRELSAKLIEESELVICMDCNSFGRTGDMESFLQSSSARKVLIDHHQNPDESTFDVVFSEQEVSSACEVLYYVLLAMPEISGDAAKLPKVSLAAMMTGLTTDTNNFANSVYPSTLSMASGLLAAGVDRDEILKNLYQSSRESRIRMWGYMLYSNLRVTDYGVAYMIMDSDIVNKFGVQEGETEGLVNEALKIKSVKMSIFLKQDGDGFFRVSVRSKKGISASKFAARYFHGGGHENAAGGRLFYDCKDDVKADIESPNGAEQYILDRSSEYFGSGDYVSKR